MADDVFGLVGEKLDGRYEVEAVVAAGGFGVVYPALSTCRNRKGARGARTRQSQFLFW